MVRESKELVLSTPGGSNPRGRKRLRLFKSVYGSDSSTYVVPLPMIAPPGFKLSLHPSGEAHIKARDTGTVARGKFNLSGLRQMVLDGTFDRVVSSFFIPPRRARFLDGVIVPYSWAKGLLHWTGTIDLAVEEMISSNIPVKLGDTRHIQSDLSLLRRAGVLHPLDMIFLTDRRADSILVFVNLFELPDLGLPDLAAPSDVRLRLTMGAALAHLRSYGGLFISIPQGRRVSLITERIGLRNLVEGFGELDTLAEQVGWKEEMQERLEEFERDFVPSLREIRPRATLRMASLRRGEKPAVRQTSTPTPDRCRRA